MNTKGFTLLELLIVVIIISILSTIALPQYARTIEKARSVEAVINIGSLRVSIERYWYDQKTTAYSYNPAILNNLDIDNPNDIINRLFNYSLIDESTQTTKSYTIKAERIASPATHWVKWIQTSNNEGKLYKSAALGGPAE